MPRALILPTLFSTSLSLLAQNWTQVPFGAHPGDRRDAAAAFDFASGKTLLFGRDLDAAGNFPNDSWLFDGATWTQAAPTTSPPGRRRHAMSCDVLRARVVMFGGYGAAGVLDDTWEWNGTDWLATNPAVRPAARYAHSMAYDIFRGRTVAFGGTSSDILPRTKTDTWEWDGVTWTQVTTANAPSEAEDTAMCFDLARGVTVLNGGTSFFGAPDQKTWEYDGVNWHDVTATVGLGPTATPGLGVMDAQMVFDPLRNRCVLFGGRTPNGTFPTDTWEYDGAAWTRRATSGPPSRTRFVMVMDLVRNLPVLYGGSNGAFTVYFHDTWQWHGVTATYATFGGGCASPLGVPTNTATSPARIGGTLTIQIGNVPAPEAALLYIGFSNTSSVYGPLPLDLGGIGAPGCFGRVSTDMEMLAFGTGNAITFAQNVPNNPAYLGLPFFTQAFALASGVNALGAVASDAAAGVVGN